MVSMEYHRQITPLRLMKTKELLGNIIYKKLNINYLDISNKGGFSFTARNGSFFVCPFRKDESNVRYLSEQFNEETFETMTPDKIYAFFSVPDTGKTTLIETILIPYLQEKNLTGLYLSHRTMIRDQAEYRYRKSSKMDVMTYQALETKIVNGEERDEYDFIICDEAHYFVCDSAINDYTLESFDFIRRAKKAIVIIMTGTPEPLEGVKEEWGRPLEILYKIDTSIHNITEVCLGTEAEIQSQLNRLIQDNQRILVYHSSKAKLRELYQKHAQDKKDECLFLCSTYEKASASLMDFEERERIIETHKTDVKIIFCTSAVSSGISIDEDFRFVFILGIPSQTEIIQVLARIRQGKSKRRITVYCVKPDGRRIYSKLESRRKELEYLQGTLKEWQKRNRTYRLPSYLMMKQEGKDNPIPKVHLLKLCDTRHQEKEYADLNMEGYSAFFQTRYSDALISTFKEKEAIEKTKKYLTTLGNPAYLVPKEQDKIKAFYHKISYCKSVSKINDLLEKYKEDYRFKPTVKRQNGKKLTLWKMERVSKDSKSVK